MGKQLAIDLQSHHHFTAGCQCNVCWGSLRMLLLYPRQNRTGLLIRDGGEERHTHSGSITAAAPQVIKAECLYKELRNILGMLRGENGCFFLFFFNKLRSRKIVPVKYITESLVPVNSCKVTGKMY